MILNYRTDNNNWFSVKMDAEFDILKIWYNDRPVTLTPMRKEILWRRINERFDLVEEWEKSKSKSRWAA